MRKFILFLQFFSTMATDKKSWSFAGFHEGKIWVNSGRVKKMNKKYGCQLSVDEILARFDSSDVLSERMRASCDYVLEEIARVRGTRPTNIHAFFNTITGYIAVEDIQTEFTRIIDQYEKTRRQPANIGILYSEPDVAKSDAFIIQWYCWSAKNVYIPGDRTQVFKSTHEMGVFVRQELIKILDPKTPIVLEYSRVDNDRIVTINGIGPWDATAYIFSKGEFKKKIVFDTKKIVIV